jgi:acyl-CoA synthetase (NDP forming)/GNAT superfamily N-acetyltransferase
MTVMRSVKGKFSVERLYAPKSVVVLGPESPEGRRVMANLLEGGFEGTLMVVGDAGPSNAALGYRHVADLPEAPDLAVLACSAAEAGPYLMELGRRGTRAAVAISNIPNLAELAAAAGIRALGPNSFGIAVPKLGLNATLSHMRVPAGRIAVMTQSAALARTVVDWAGPNGVGFSHIIGVGGNTDLGFGLGLDWLSRDPGTGLILMDIRRVRSRRAFISAARAASRLRPVVAIRPGGRLLDPSGQSDEVFAAALNRAGVFVVRHLDEFLAAAETLSRSKPARGEAVAIVTNAIGPGRLAADAALEAGIKIAILPPHAQSALAASLPADLVYGLVYAGSAAPTQVAELAAVLSAVPEVGGVLVLLAPTGAGDATAIAAVIAAASTAKLPVLTCVMGETSGAAHRRRLAEAGLPAFSTPEQAVQAFNHLLRDRRARIAARELPGNKVLDVAPDHAAVARILAAARAAGRMALTRAEGVAVLAAYGIAFGEGPAGAIQASLRVHEDLVFGPAISLIVGSGRPHYELPPLNLPLAQALARRAGLAEAPAAAAAQVLVRVSQLLVDEPSLGVVGLDPLWLHDAGATAGEGAIWLRPAGEAAVLAIPPYPENLIEHWISRGQAFTIRPIRPEDAAAHAAFVKRVPPEDVRFRFFTAMKEISPEQMSRLTQIDYEREMAFIAVRDADGATVGVARLVREVGEASGEFAILVQPDVKGLGLASHLMERLIGWAREGGLADMTGMVLAENHAMLGFVRHLGFEIKRVPDEPEVIEAVMAL